MEFENSVDPRYNGSLEKEEQTGDNLLRLGDGFGE